MASVRETKEALEQARGTAYEAAETAISAINTLLNIQVWALGIIALVIALVAIFGWQSVRRGAKETAERIARKRVDSYIKSKEFADLIDVQVREKLEGVVGKKVIMNYLTEAPKDEEPAPFEKLEERKP